MAKREKLACDKCPQREFCGRRDEPYFVEKSKRCFFLFDKGDKREVLNYYYWLKQQKKDGFFWLETVTKPYLSLDDESGNFRGLFIAHGMMEKFGISNGSVFIEQAGTFRTVVNLLKDKTRIL